MADQYIGEIRAVGFNFAPQGWAMCNGQLLPISQNTALFSLLGTSYGGNGTTTFALPDLRVRFPLHAANGSAGPGLSAVQLGENVGATSVTLTAAELPTHTHVPAAVDAAGTVTSPANATWAKARTGRTEGLIYATGGAVEPMDPGAVLANGGGQPHNNLPPYQVVNFIIALQGVYPPRS